MSKPVLAITVLVLGLFSAWFSVGSGVSYTTLLLPGHSAQYNVSGSYNETVDTTEMLVLNVQGSKLTVRFTDHYQNSSETRTDVYWLDLQTGMRNSSNLIFAIAAGLNPGDPVPNSEGPGFSVTREETHACGTLARQTNYATFSDTNVFGTQTLGFYWDKATGVLCDFYLQDPGGTLNLKMITTNIPFPEESSPDYLIPALVGAFLLLLLVPFVWKCGGSRRRRAGRR